MISARESTGLLLGLVGVVIFGATLPATRLAVSALDPWFVTAGRAALAGLLATGLLLAMRRAPPKRALWSRYGLGALCLVAGFPGFTGLAMLTVPVAHGGVVLGVLPLATAAAGAWLLGERAPRLFWFFAFLGAAVVVGFAVADGAGGLGQGDLFLVLAGLSAALGYVLSAELTRERPGWEVISWMLVLSLPVTVPAAIVLAPPWTGIVAAPVPALLGFAYVTLMSQFVGFFAWNAGLALGGVARVSQVQLLQTFVTLALAAVVNGEVIDGATLTVALLVLAIVAAGQAMRRRQAPA